MKKLYVLTIGLLAWANVGFAQCSSINLFITSQSQIDSFPDNYPGCTSVESLYLMSSDVTDLNGLSQITEITGDCEIRSMPDGLGNYPLTNISGLNNVTTIGGTLRFFDVPNLTTTNFFSSLTFVGDLLQIDSKLPVTLTGFNSLTHIDGSLQLITTNGLKHLNCFQALQSIGLDPGVYAGMLYFTGGDEIETVSGFSNLSYLGSDLWLTNTKLTSAPNMPLLTSVSNLRIYNNPLLTNITGFGSLSISGDLAISNNASLSTCNVPNICAHISNGGNSNISSNAGGCANVSQISVTCGNPQGCDNTLITLYSQEDVDNYPFNYGCTELTGSLLVRNLANDITNLNGLSGITKVEGVVEIVGSSIQNMHGLDNLEYVGDNLYAYLGPNLDTSNLFPALEHAGGIYIGGDTTNPTATTLAGFNSLTYVDMRLVITGAKDLQTINGFHNLEEIGFPGSSYHGLIIEQNNALTAVTAFESLTYIGMQCKINLNPSLLSMPTFNALTTIGKELIISNNNAMTSLNGLQQLESILSLELYNNTALTDISALSGLQTVTSSIVVTGNAQLAVCNNAAICSLLPTTTSSISNNAPGCNSKEQVLVACGTPQNCDNITLSTQTQVDDFVLDHGCTAVTGTFTISGTDITNLNGLTGITAAEHVTFYEVTNLSDYSGLNNLATVSGNLSFTGSSASAISGFTGLQTIGGNLSVYNVSATSISGFTNLESVGGSFDFTGNLSLSTITGFGNLESVTGAFAINSNSVLVSLPTMTSFTASDSNFSIQSNSALTSLSGLNSLATINGNLNITDNIALINVNALSSLTTVNGGIYISGNAAIASLSGLDNINWESVSSLNINSNANLTTCNNLFVCNFISNGGNTTISGNAVGCENSTRVSLACGNVPDCENVYLFSQADVDNFPINYGCTTISGTLNIVGNDITNLDTLSGVTSIGDLVITDVPNLSDYSGLDNVTELTVGFYLGGATPSTITMLPNVVSIVGSFNIYQATNLVSLSGFGSVQYVVSDISASYNTALTQLPNFSSLIFVGGSIVIASNPAIQTVNNFPALEGINGALYFINNPSLTDISGIASIDPESMSGISIYDNTQLAVCNVPNICSFLAIGGIADIHDNAVGCENRDAVLLACNPGCPQGDIVLLSQSDVDDFGINYATCATALGNVLISGDDITNLNGLSSITAISGNLSIVSNDQLTGLSALANLDKIYGSLYITNNPTLTSLTGLNAVAKVDYLEIRGNAQLLNLTGLSGLESVEETMTITANDVMTSLSGLTNLQFVNGSIEIYENASLTSLSGLSITSANTLGINRNPMLTSLSGLENLQTVNTFHITENNNLLNLQGLGGLTSVTNMLYISLNPLLYDLSGLNALQSVGSGGLVISNNDVLYTLGALSNLTAASVIDLTENTVLEDISGLSNVNPAQLTQLTIKNNPILAICNLSNFCSYLSLDGSATIMGNAYGCINIIQIGAACGFVCANYYQDNDQDTYGTGTATFTCTGAPSGYVTNDDDCDDNDELITTQCHPVPTILDLKLFIQGYYRDDLQAMASVRDNQQIGGANPLEVETLTVELRDPNSLDLVIATTAVLQTNGELECSFPIVLDDQYYIVVKGRNILETWSLTPIMITFGSSYDFSLLASQAYGNNQVEVSPGVWAFYSGDTNQDGSVDFSDYALWEADFNEFAYGDKDTDINGDGSVDLSDYSIWEAGFNNFIYAKRPL